MLRRKRINIEMLILFHFILYPNQAAKKLEQYPQDISKSAQIVMLQLNHEIQKVFMHICYVPIHIYIKWKTKYRIKFYENKFD